jgi:hypothetical protein
METTVMDKTGKESPQDFRRLIGALKQRNTVARGIAFSKSCQVLSHARIMVDLSGHCYHGKTF